MLKVKIFRTQEGFKPPKLLCTLGWDDEKEEIVILFGREYARRLLKDRFLDKMTMKHISIEDGGKFIERLPYALIGSYVWASETYFEEA